MFDWIEDNWAALLIFAVGGLVFFALCTLLLTRANNQLYQSANTETKLMKAYNTGGKRGIAIWKTPDGLWCANLYEGQRVRDVLTCDWDNYKHP